MRVDVVDSGCKEWWRKGRERVVRGGVVGGDGTGGERGERSLGVVRVVLGLER